MPALKISICVVLFESVELTQRFHQELLDSLSGHDDFEVLYFDNSLTDRLETWFSARQSAQVRYWRDPRNLGFSFGNNQLILRARHENVLLLNPDVFGLNSEKWSRIADLALNGEARFARLLNADGSFQDCVGETASLLRPLKNQPAYAHLRQATEVGMGIMAFMLTTKTVFSWVGLLDCAYPLYAEDMDWCQRARQAGVKVIFDPTIELTHIGGASAGDRWNLRESRRRKYRAEKIFIDKHFRGLGWLAMRALNLTKMALKA